MICEKCGKERKYLVNKICTPCYHKKHGNFFYHDKKNVKIKHVQRNVITSIEKTCSICGKKYFTQGRKNHGKTCSLACRKKHYTNYHAHPRIKAQRKAYHLSHLKERTNYLKRKELENPLLKLSKNVRSNLRINLIKFFKTNKNSRFESLVGYSYFDLKVHLEKQFTSEMSWENYGIFWQVDHIVPLSWFKTREQFLKYGWALKNIQPLESELNLAKQNLYCGNPKTNLEVISLSDTFLY